MIRVGVFGAAGRMGRTVCAAVAADDDLDLVATVDPSAVGEEVEGVVVTAGPEALADAGATVAVDFTAADAARANLAWCADHGVHAVVGTTGLGDDDRRRLAGAFTASSCMLAPNFAIGAVVLMRLAELAAPWFDSVEVIELHHDSKIDAPSGTAMLTAERVAAASAGWTPDPTTVAVLEGARGGVGPGGIPVHSVRLRGLVAHEEVLFGTTGQSLTLRHDSYDRSSFVPGVLLAVKRVHERPGLTIGLDALLGM